MSINHIVRAPQTDRYGLEVPCKPSELGCTPVVVAVRDTNFTLEAGTNSLISVTRVSRDTESLVTSQAPLTITAKHAGTYLAVLSVVWDLGTAFADRIISYETLVDGVSAITVIKAIRFGGGHTEQVLALLTMNAGSAVTFRLTNVAGGNVTLIAAQVNFINVGP